MYGNIFINLKGREPDGIVEPGEEYDRVCTRIKDQLCSLTDPETGENIVERVYRRDELYHGPYVEIAPDLLIAWKDYAYYTSVSHGQEDQSIFGSFLKIDSSEYTHVGTHRLNGVFMASGKLIRSNTRIDSATIYDISPTILYILGLPIPADMDGRVLSAIFREEYLQNNPPRYDNNQLKTADETIVHYSEKENRQVAERLRGLGYLE
jgi:predicted AlkP superfamily phosphohydrolase/phosphomutase